jgi:hypothetical protein
MIGKPLGWRKLCTYRNIPIKSNYETSWEDTTREREGDRGGNNTVIDPGSDTACGDANCHNFIVHQIKPPFCSYIIQDDMLQKFS